MGLIYHDKIGRGLTWGKATIQAAWDSFAGNSLNNFNFSTEAGIPELYVQWYAGESSWRHTHKDGSLAPASLGVAQVNLDTFDKVQFVKAQQSGVTMIAGVVTGPGSHQDGAEGYVNFGDGSRSTGTRFLPGTIPTVLLTLVTTNTGTPTKFYSIYLTEVTSTGFRYRYSSNETTPRWLWYIHYVAIGAAPGLISSPTGV